MWFRFQLLPGIVDSRKKGGVSLKASIFVLLMIALAAYFAPSIISHIKDKKNKTAIFALNLLLGWTFIGWVVSLVWSLTND